MKGADDVMRTKVSSNDNKIVIDEKTYELASIGLRTLCFAFKNITDEQYQDFEKKFNENLLKNDHKKND